MRLTPLRLLTFAVCVAAFFGWFGYWPSNLPTGDFFSYRSILRGYWSCAALFLVACGLTCFGEKEYGLFPPTSLRPMLIVVGALAMLIATVWMHSLRTAHLPPPPQISA